MTDQIKTNGFHLQQANNTIDLDVAKQCAEALNKHYPGYMWGVNANNETGMVQVRNFTLSGEWGFDLHMINVINDPSLKRVIQAGGEILERYKLARGAANEDRIDELETDFAGRIAVDAA